MLEADFEFDHEPLPDEPEDESYYLSSPIIVGASSPPT